MKKADRSKGYFLCLLLNMLFRWEWLMVSLILLVLHYILPAVPLWLFAVPLVCWFVHSLLVTALISFGNRCNNIPRVQSDNKNPYSKSDSDVFPG